MSREYVEITVNDEYKRKILGRCLGFLTSSEASKIVNSSETQNKVKTKPTLLLSSIIEKEDRSVVKNLRLIFVIKKLNNCIVENPKFFITDEIDYFSQITPYDFVTIVTKNEEVISLKKRLEN